MPATIEALRPFIIATLSAVLAIVASAHAILNKRDVRAAAAWVGVIWLVPVLGSVLYALLGINRIRRRATELRKLGVDISYLPRDTYTDWQIVAAELSEPHGHLETLARVVGRVTGRPLLAGNRLVPLVNGDAAYPAMLEAIERADRSIALCTYIFDHDEVGVEFSRALGQAVSRGVAVRVLIDAVGARYSFPSPSIIGELKSAGVPVARFMRTLWPWRMPFANLRSHRKVLVVDGMVGFTGGMNIRVGHVLARNPRRPVQDLQFRVEGPIVEQLMQVFAEDWAFTTREVLQDDIWFPRLEHVGPVVARGISDGPGLDLDKLRMTLLGAIAAARSKVTIVTPYFLPDRELISALNIASMSGVDVRIVLPGVNNQPLVAWAAMAQHWQLLERDCRIFLTAPPFDHTKLMIVDDVWTLIGSANWDPRSLRLNFEYNVECYDRGLAREMEQLTDNKLEGAQQLSQSAVDARSLPVKMRDGIARLLSPYM
ncbi:MAG: PLDc N-terminal domain-containing protein [Gemmatimonadota bacterium]|nr:MAG: PLDc N-terminal domain-containing protein [Gemmatimonadota bacterium]